MKRLVVLVGLVVILAGLLLPGVSDTSASATDTTIPDNEVTTSVSEAANSDSASATITITMYTLANEQGGSDEE